MLQPPSCLLDRNFKPDVFSHGAEICFCLSAKPIGNAAAVAIRAGGRVFFFCVFFFFFFFLIPAEGQSSSGREWLFPGSCEEMLRMSGWGVKAPGGCFLIPSPALRSS